ncbi:MAG: hypothetical protein ACI4KM_02195 [Oscillospiraceae bacterium]
MENGLLERTTEETKQQAAAESEQPVTEPSAETAVELESAPPAETIEQPEQTSQGAALGERDREILDALDVMFNKNDPTPIKLSPVPPKNQKTSVQKLGRGVVQKGAGIISLSLILIFMGVVMIVCLFSSDPDYMLPLKLSPVAAVLLGVELLVHYLMSGRNFRVHTLSIVFCAVVVAGSCFMAVALDKSYRETRTACDNRSIAAEIYDSSYKELKYIADIAQLEVTVDINPLGKSAEKGMSALSADDYVKIELELDGKYSTPTEFAEECKSIIDGYRLMRIPVTDYSFRCEDRFNSFRLDVNGSFMQDCTVSELVQRVYHVYIENYDYIDDLDDFVGETTETESASA